MAVVAKCDLTFAYLKKMLVSNHFNGNLQYNGLLFSLCKEENNAIIIQSFLFIYNVHTINPNTYVTWSNRTRLIA